MTVWAWYDWPLLAGAAGLLIGGVFGYVRGVAVGKAQSQARAAALIALRWEIRSQVGR